MEKPILFHRQDRGGVLLYCPQQYLNIRHAEAGRCLAGGENLFEFKGRFAVTLLGRTSNS